MSSSRSWLLLAAGLSVVGALLFAFEPSEVHGDTWIALMAGREVAHSGIPSHDTLTIAAHGRPWFDQQWLAQLCMYELDRLGGLPLAGFVNVLLLIASVIGAAAGALRLGARLRGVGWILPLVVCALPMGLEIRTQAYAYPLMVAVVYLLARDARRPTAQVWWCLPLLVLWGNLHGSALMGAGLVGLRGLVLGWENRVELAGSRRAWAKPLGLLVGAGLCLLANPYGPSIASYYRATVFNPELRKLIAEWQPLTTESWEGLLLAVLVGVAIWSVARHPRQSTLWDRWALLVLAIGAVVAVRNVPWFGLAALVLLPVWVDHAAPAPVWRSRWSWPLAAGLAAFGAIWLLQGAVRTFTSRNSAWAPDYPAGALTAVRSELGGHPGWRLYGDDYVADWLLFELPQLRGRVTTDARFELLSAAQMRSQVALVFRRGSNWKRAARGDRMLVFDPHGSSPAVAGFRREPGARVVYRSAHVVVIVRSAAASLS